MSEVFKYKTDLNSYLYFNATVDIYFIRIFKLAERRVLLRTTWRQGKCVLYDITNYVSLE